MKPLAIDLYCGLGGWTEGLMAEGFYVVGFDNVRHAYGDHAYPGQLVLQDVLTLHGRQFKDAALIVGSSPCQEFSYRAMPWKRAKALPPPELGIALFKAQFRIQREASRAAGRHIPMVVENVVGAQKWVGRARWHYGSYYLWGDVPALMPMVRRIAKRPAHDWNRFKATGEVSPHWRLNGEDSRKNTGGSWFGVGHPQGTANNNPTKVNDGRDPMWARGFQMTAADQLGRNDPRDDVKVLGHLNQRNGHRSTSHLTNPEEHIKQGGDWFNDATPGSLRSFNGKGSKRKAASAMIAKIPLPLARHIARTYYPRPEEMTHGSAETLDGTAAGA